MRHETRLNDSPSPARRVLKDSIDRNQSTHKMCDEKPTLASHQHKYRSFQFVDGQILFTPDSRELCARRSACWATRRCLHSVLLAKVRSVRNWDFRLIGFGSGFYAVCVYCLASFIVGNANNAHSSERHRHTHTRQILGIP